jgi:hypothetical protein
VTRRLRRFVLSQVVAVSIGLVCAAGEARAECVALAGSAVCTSFVQATAVFFADVENVRTLPSEPFRVDITFRIVEVFKRPGHITSTLRFAPSIDGYRFDCVRRLAWVTCCR